MRNHTGDYKILCGTDMVLCCRFAELWQKFGLHLADHLFTEKEFAAFLPNPGEHTVPLAKIRYLSGIYAVKEACAKALGTGIMRYGVKLRDMEVQKYHTGKPYVTFTGKVKEITDAMGIKSLDCSISHDGDYVIAFVVMLALRDEGTK